VAQLERASHFAVGHPETLAAGANPADHQRRIRRMMCVGWAVRRGSLFMLGELFNPSKPGVHLSMYGLSRDLCRVRDGVRVDQVVAVRADDERLAAHSCHEDGPRGLSRSGFPERLESGDLVAGPLPTARTERRACGVTPRRGTGGSPLPPRTRGP
jgi:hypothetical protein